MQGYLTKQECIAIPGAGDLIIRSLLDRQQYDDPLGEAERLGISSAAWPLFGLLWPSGLRLAARLSARPVRAGERILEIGCGLALASLVGHRRGADVTASDCHPLARSFLDENLRLNNLPPMKYVHGPWGGTANAAGPDSVSEDGGGVSEDRGGRDGGGGVSEDRGGRDGGGGGGGGKGDDSQRYDLIIGSDILYERDEGGVLAAFIGRHCRACAEVWVVDPNRGNRPAFNRQMARLDFAMTEERLDTPATATSAAYKGRILIYRKTGAKAAAAALPDSFI